MSETRGHRWRRLVVARLCRALRRGDVGEMSAAGALAAALVEQEPDGQAATRRAVALLDVVVVAPAAGFRAAARARLERASDDLHRLPADASPTDVARFTLAAIRDAAEMRTPPSRAPRLESMVPRYLGEHLQVGARLSDLARALGYSPSHASSLVRRATGVPFTVLRRRMQLERALGLLRRGTSVKEAALTAGFSEPAYFSRVFARCFGVPPSRWREVVEAGPVERAM